MYSVGTLTAHRALMAHTSPPQITWKNGLLNPDLQIQYRRDTSDLSKLDLKSSSVQQPLFMEPLPFPCHPERSRGICGVPEPQTKAPTSEFADLSKAVCSSLTRPSLEATSFSTALLLAPITRSGDLRTVSFPGNKGLGKIREFTRGAFVWGSGAPQVPRLRSEAVTFLVPPDELMD